MTNYMRRPLIFSAAQQIAYLERAAAHTLAGWLPKAVAIETKLALGRFLYTSMDNAVATVRAIQSSSLPLGGWAVALPEGWSAYAAEIYAASSDVDLLWSLFADLKVRIRELSTQLLQRTDPIADVYLRERIEATLRSTESQIAWYQALGLPVASEERVRTLRALWDARDNGMMKDSAGLVWAPRDRVPSPARPAHLRHAKRGSISSHAIYPNNGKHTREMFHRMFDEELTTMELFARCSYEHPDMPEEFHWAMARQASDESRHAQMCLDQLAEFGGQYGDMPISDGVYTFHYQYEPCEPGSKRELMWRLLLRSAFEEALSLDGFVLQVRKRDFFEEASVSRVLEAIMADEIHHVRSGWRWSTFLNGGDRAKTREELEQAHAWDLKATEDIRRKFVYENQEEALEELDFVKKRDSFVPKLFPFDLDITLNRVARSAAGMTDEDMAQVVDWGYVKPDAAATSEQP